MRLEVLRKAAAMLEKENLPVTKRYLEEGKNSSSPEGRKIIHDFISI